MVAWEQEFKTNVFWQSLESLEAQLEDSTPGQLTSTAKEIIDQMRWQIRFLLSARNTPSLLISRARLTGLESSIASARSQVMTWQGGGGEIYLENALSTVFSVIDTLGLWPPRDEAERSFSEAASTAMRSAAELYDALRRSTTEAQERLAALTTAADAIVERAKDFELAHERRIEALDIRMDSAITDLNDAYLRTESERNEKFSADAAERAQRAKDAEDEYQQAYDATLNKLREDEQKALDLVHAIGLTSTATEYGHYAKEQSSRAFWWSIAAVAISVVGLSVLAVYLLLEAHSGKAVAWQTEVLRIGTSAAVLAVGGYCASQSREHRIEANKSKAKQLDLKALDPFIADLTQEQQRDIKVAAARRLFVEDNDDTKSVNNLGLGVADIMKQVTDRSKATE